MGFDKRGQFIRITGMFRPDREASYAMHGRTKEEIIIPSNSRIYLFRSQNGGSPEFYLSFVAPDTPASGGGSGSSGMGAGGGLGDEH
jgi:hypothetical protein